MGKKARIKEARRARTEKLVQEILEIEDEEARLTADIVRMEGIKADEFKKMLTVQEGQGTLKIQDVLTGEQITACVEILNNTPDYQQAKKLTAYLNQFKGQIEAKGFIVSYLAYVLVAMGQKARKQQNQDQDRVNKPVPPNDPHGFFGAN